MVPQYKQQLDSMMSHELSRGEFLKFMGLALLGFIGVIGFFKNLFQIMPAHTAAKKQLAPSGYGRSAYGR